MRQSPPPDLLSRARQLLVSLVATPEDREALLTEAFYLHEPRLYAMDRQGEPKTFVLHCIKRLLDFGPLPNGEHALARLLAAARYDCEPARHAEVDALISLANALSPQAPPPAAKLSSQPSGPPPLPPSSTPSGPAPLQTLATPPDERQPTVFISYAHADAEFAKRLIGDVRAAGHACWIDETELKGGDEWIMTIADGINNSYAFVVVVTRKAIESRWVQDEILWARQRNKRIVPLMLEDVFSETRFFPLASYQGIRFFDRDYAEALPGLLGALPDPAAGAIGKLPGNARKAELAYLERLRLEELLNTEKYTPMGGATRRQESRAEMRAVFELMAWGKAKHSPEPRRFENAVEELLRIRRAVLLGEPGGGKTTTLWKLADHLAAAALADRAAPIPLLIRLGKWTDAAQSLPDFIASQLGDLGASLAALLAERRAALLLDGLNELPAGQRDVKYPRVKQLIEAHRALLAVVSCRELDYTVDLGFDRIQITPLDPIRIREFARRYLDEETGDALFWKLAGERTRYYHSEFMEAVGPQHEAIFWLTDHPPNDLKWTYSWDNENKYSLWGDWIAHRETPSSLMALSRNPYMLLMLTSVFAEARELPENRGELFRLFVERLLRREGIPESEQAPLVEGLAKVAYEMQVRRAPGDEYEEDEADALTVLPKEQVGAMLDERLLYLAGSASILSLGDQVRFTHQLLQEYFAAKFMDLEIRAGRLQAMAIWPPDRWWQRTNWEEAAILLAGLYSDDCSRIVEWLAEANPEVAAMCAVRGGAALAEATAERLRAKWIPRLTDLKRDPDAKARAAVGRAMGLIGGDNRKGVGIVRDARGVALPDIDWVEIPGGEFQYGDESEGAAKPQRLTLPAFHISRYPVTFAQFQTFLDDPEGFADPRWFEGMAAGEDERRMDEQEYKFANHPRDRVSWYQAMAFCRWLSWRLSGGADLKKVADWSVRLPTEFEWEKAARGADGRIYPYKGEFDAAKGNTNETGIGQTSAVGIFPNGASPYGVMDLSGNVLEWCLSNYDKPAMDARKENLRNNSDRVLRGGSWFYIRVRARSVSRNNNLPANRNNSVGCRVLCVVRPPSL